MNSETVTQKLENLDIRTDMISDDKLRNDVLIIFSLVEELCEENEQLKIENQKLRDENAQLKGEQGKPKILPEKKKNISSDDDRKKHEGPQKKEPEKKKSEIKINRKEVCKVDKSILPADAEFKGYYSVTVQEIKIETDNVEYRKEVYYSASENKTYIGELPPGIKGVFGPGVKALVARMKYECNMSEPKIREFLNNEGIQISGATISRILTKDIEVFHEEKEEIFKSGLKAAVYQQIDDTTTRVNGNNCYTQVICNPYYTAFFTDTHKNRLSVIDILQGCGVRIYYFTEEAFNLLCKFGLSLKMINKLRELASGKKMDEDEMEELLENIFSDSSKGRNLRSRIREAAAIAAYHWQSDFPVIKVLLSDDAPQYKHLTVEHGLCWVHEGRHFKKLSPVVPENIVILKDFRKHFWEYYGKLLRYKTDPTSEQAEALTSEFDVLFSTRTEYKALNERIEMTEGKKAALLKVLEYPELPLHNNAAEPGARAQKRRQDVSLHTKTEEGAKAGDTFMTIVETAKKLGVSTKEYFEDRISGKFLIPSLADLISKKALQIENCIRVKRVG